jgi:hypothetical protein
MAESTIDDILVQQLEHLEEDGDRAANPEDHAEDEVVN